MIAAPQTNDPVASRPLAIRASAMSRPSPALASTPCTTVAVVGRIRPAGVAAIGSARPCSSSARVWRTARNVLIRPPMRASQAKSRKNANAPSSMPFGVPRKTRMVRVAIATPRISRRSCSSP